MTSSSSPIASLQINSIVIPPPDVIALPAVDQNKIASPGSTILLFYTSVDLPTYSFFSIIENTSVQAAMQFSATGQWGAPFAASIALTTTATFIGGIGAGTCSLGEAVLGKEPYPVTSTILVATAIVQLNLQQAVPLEWPAYTTYIF